MSLNNVTLGNKVPETINVIIEIPMTSDPIKYEVDKEAGALFVDRFVGTVMHYPTNYGYAPQTIAGDGDPVDVLVLTPFPIVPGAVIHRRPIGILNMEDKSGLEGRVLALPTQKILPLYNHINKLEDPKPSRLNTIAHFFEHYKNLEEGKWVKLLS